RASGTVSTPVTGRPTMASTATTDMGGFLRRDRAMQSASSATTSRRSRVMELGQTRRCEMPAYDPGTRNFWKAGVDGRVGAGRRDAAERWTDRSGVAQRRLQARQLRLDPARIDGPPVVDAVAAGVVSFALALLEDALDVQLGQRLQGVLGGAPGHAGGGHDGWHTAGGVAGNQPGHVQAAIEAGPGLAGLHAKRPS